MQAQYNAIAVLEFSKEGQAQGFYPKQMVLIINPYSVLNILKTTELVKSVILLD